MSKFPIVEQLSVPQAAGYNAPQVVSADVTAVPEATAKLGSALEKVGGAILQIKDRHDKFNYSIARSKALEQTVNLQTDLDNSPDYQDAPQKFEEGMKKIKEDTLASLEGNNHKELLGQELNLLQAKQTGAVIKNSEQKQQAFGMATAAKQEDANLEVFLKTKDSEVQKTIINSTKENFALSIPYNVPNRDLMIAKNDEQVNKRFVTADIVSRPPQEQINILKAADKDTEGKGIARLIPADERMKLMDRAETLLEQQKNDAERAAAKADRQAKLNIDNELLRGATSGASFDQLPLAVQLRASDQDVKRYDAIRQKQLGIGAVNPTEQEKNYYQYQDDFINNPTKFAEVSPLDIAANVPLSKQNEVLGWQKKAVAPASLVQFDTIANGTLRQVGINLATQDGKTQAAKFKERMNQESEAFTETHKRQPSYKELTDMAHGLVVKQSFEGSVWGTNEKRVYQVPREEFNKRVVVPDEFKNKVIQLKKENGINTPTTEDQFKQLYLKQTSSNENGSAPTNELAYALPARAYSPEDIKRSLEDELAKHPNLYKDLDLDKESDKIYKRYYKNDNSLT